MRELTWQKDSPVVRRGIDADGWPTWWHADGTLTKRTMLSVTKDGETAELENVITLDRAPERALVPKTASGTDTRPTRRERQ